MKRLTHLLIMSSLAFTACGDDDVVTFDAGGDTGPLPDVPMMDIEIFDGGDPCTGVDPARICATAGTSCTGDTLVTCEANVNGCLVTTETDCSTVAGATCDDTGAVAMCTSDPCMGVSDCDMEARSCDADTLTVCAPDAAGCLVTTTTDCAADGTTCDDTGAMAVCLDACDGISDCDTEGRTCDGDTLNVCAPDAAGCLVNTATDCSTDGNLCDPAADPVACVAPPCAPADASGVTIDCDSGTITGSTTGGTTALDGICSSTANYEGAEVVYRFADARVAAVTLSFERTSGTEDMDLFVMDAGDGTAACDTAAACPDASRGGSATEEVTFTSLPGDNFYVVYDVWNNAAGTADFTATVTCEFSTCGDSTIEGAEVCDDGNATAGDGCSDTCQVEPGYECTGAGPSTCVLTCGNSVIDGADECDDGNTTAGDGCSDVCVIEDGYLCTEDGAGLSTCALSCFDGVVNGEDECDDNNGTDGDGCSATCTVEPGFQCTEDGAGLSTCERSCGNDVIDGDDQCDDGNTMDGDGCSSTCEVEGGFTCIFEPSECTATLDSIDGVLENTDTAWSRTDEDCSATTRDHFYEAVVYTNAGATDQLVDIYTTYEYDGYVHVYTGLPDPADSTIGCVVGNDDFEGLGSGLLQGITVPAGGSITIVVSAFSTGLGAFNVNISESRVECGDGVIEAFEECDDENMMDSDGCSSACVVETGFVCTGEPSSCTVSLCGNAMVDGNEVCDGTAGCAADCRSLVITGSIVDTGTTWARPFSSCSGSNAGRFFDTVSFTNAAGVDQDYDFTVAWTGVDGYLFVYDSPFDSTMPLTGCLSGNDDFGGFSGSQVAGETVTAGSTVDVVMTTFSAGDTGDYELTISLP